MFGASRAVCPSVPTRQRGRSTREAPCTTRPGAHSSSWFQTGRCVADPTRQHAVTLRVCRPAEEAIAGFVGKPGTPSRDEMCHAWSPRPGLVQVRRGRPDSGGPLLSDSGAVRVTPRRARSPSRHRRTTCSPPGRSSDGRRPPARRRKGACETTPTATQRRGRPPAPRTRTNGLPRTE